MNNVIILQELRLSSQRLPRKVLAEFGSERLIDRGLRVLKYVEQQTGFPVRVVAWEGEREIVDAIHDHGLRWQPKSEASSRAEAWSDQFDGWQDDLRDYNWALFINAVCHPFMRFETIRDMAWRARNSNWPWVSALRERGQAWDEFQRPLIDDHHILSSKASPIVLRPSHMATACAISDTRETRRILKPEPSVFEVGKLELIDIDTREDLDFARLMAAGLNGGNYDE